MPAYPPVITTKYYVVRLSYNLGTTSAGKSIKKNILIELNH